MSDDQHVAPQYPSYFLISVSTRENLELCIKHALAGFPSGESGAWTFCEIQLGDFVSFLYGAKVYNLYRVAQRDTLAAAERLPPWKLLTFRETGREYSFPFRLRLEPIREFAESLVRAEFAYVAENLLLRGGYRKTHFQADQTTLQSVSEMGRRATTQVSALALPEHATFTLRFTRDQQLLNMPETCRFKEPILQSAIRRHLSAAHNLEALLTGQKLQTDNVDGLEVLGEMAIPLGHIDLLLKQRVPLGTAMKIPIEVKAGGAQAKDVSQLKGYMDELRGDCSTGILIAASFGKSAVTRATNVGIGLVRYELNSDLKHSSQTFEEIWGGMTLKGTSS